MITSNTKKPFGGKAATIETLSFSCFISTAKDSFFRKQSLVIWDTSEGFSNRQLAAKMEYNDQLDSAARLELHETVIRAIDESGMNGVPLRATLETILIGLHDEGIGTPSFLEAWWTSKGGIK